MNYLNVLKSRVVDASTKVQTFVSQVDTSQFSLDNLQKKMDEALTNNTIPDGVTGHRVNGLDFTYVTPRLVAMGFPTKLDESKPSRANRIEAVAALLNSKHKDRYMIWNLSEEEYDYDVFNNQVQEYRFPGHPAPPLGLLFQICTSLESWLAQDTANVAVVHCLTGKGRTASVLACVLSWIGEIESPVDAMQHVARKRRVPEERLVIPSQRRYVQYFTSVMDGVKPRAEPVVLKRVIVNTIPTFFKKDGSDSLRAGESTCDGCRPYLQVFKNGKLLYSSTWRDSKNAEDMQVYYTSDGSFSFNVDCTLEGDILIRCRHVDENGKRSSMFRAAFHTGYIPQGIQRLQKSQCDGANFDRRFAVDFFVDLIFQPISSKARRANSASTGPMAAHYEDLVSANSKFWSEISKRKEKIRQARAKGWRSIIDRRPVEAATVSHDSTATDRRKGSSEGDKTKKVVADIFSIADDDTSPVKAGSSMGTNNARLSTASLAAAAVKQSKNLAKQTEQKRAEKEKESIRLAEESNQQLDELADLEKELGLESLSQELRKFDDLPKDVSSTSPPSEHVTEGTGKNRSTTPVGVDVLEDELKDLDAELALLGEDNLEDYDNADEPGDLDLDDAEFAELEKHFDSLS
eukprot:Stramenopile-MAST_4_protein_1769